MTPFDTEDDDPNEGEEAASPADTQTTIDDILNAIQGLRETREELDKMKTSGQNLTIKANALRAMNNVILLEGSIQRLKKDCQQIKSPRTQSHPSETDRIANIEKSIRELKAGQAAIHEAVMTKPKAWTTVAASTPKRTSTTVSNDPDHGQTERLDKFRMERAKTEVKLLTRSTTDEMKKQLADMTETDLIKILSNASGCEIRGVRKLANYGLKIRCRTEKEAETLRNVPWGDAIEGVTVIKNTFGIVVHGVDKYDVDFNKDDPEELKTEIERANRNHFKIQRIMPLRRRARNPNAIAQSIVILLDDPNAADDCIEGGINIGSEHYHAVRYMPHCQIIQCFNCQGYGHKADTCKKKPRCGKCAKEYSTSDCNDDTVTMRAM